ncbi:restriction endonuclease subunit S [Pseudomonas parasichuanensis]|uniref:restriction endonuclease subunit S n=1 Tax=Pseudomonas parasichuanensis TaxID=2892329 RepID=UPI001F2B42E1|nr:restriction endonuclease subunit S [Pseudomonas parasichuanensis]
MTKQQLPEGWQTVKFGDIAKHISKRVEPSETEHEVYVGLEHLDPESLKIKRHGVPSDVAGQKLLVKKGQIIFGKRRAYQRKVAVADWDCICSAHAMVLEAKPEKVVPEFLPFFMQSDVFMNRAVSISEGSLSPTIKWKALERQEFKVPTKERQRALVDVFASLQLNIFHVQDALVALDDLRRRIISSFLQRGREAGLASDIPNGRLSGSWKIVSLEDIFINKDSMRVPIKSSDRKKISGGIPYYGASGIIDYVDRHIFDEPILLLSEDGANLVERKTPIAFKVEGKSFVNNHAHVYKPKDVIDIDYIVALFECMDISPHLTGTAQPKLNKNKADSILFPYPPRDEKVSFVSLINSLTQERLILEGKLAEFFRLRSLVGNGSDIGDQ